MKQHRGVFIAVLLGMTALACAIPGLPPASSIPPTPDTRLEQMVAETVSAALVLTQQAVPTPTEVPLPPPHHPPQQPLPPRQLNPLKACWIKTQTAQAPSLT